MEIQKIRIVSNNICYGPEPSPEDEVEQHLTISANGRVWIVGYNYAGGFGNYKIGRRQQFSIGKDVAADILLLVSQYFNNEPLSIDATDIGDWKLTITDADHKDQKYQGSLCGGLTVSDKDLTDYIRKHIPVNDLFVFGGGVDEDEDEE